MFHPLNTKKFISTSHASAEPWIFELGGILFGDSMVPNIEEDYILLLGYSILYKEYNLTRFNQKQTLLNCVSESSTAHSAQVAEMSIPCRVRTLKRPQGKRDICGSDFGPPYSISQNGLRQVQPPTRHMNVAAYLKCATVKTSGVRLDLGYLGSWSM